MRFLHNLERKLSRFAVPHLTLGLIFLQVLVYILHFSRPELLLHIQLIPQKVLEGEVWRAATFLCQPPITNPIFAFFFWYFLYLMGMALEAHWGTFRYNLYLLIGYLATLSVAFLNPEIPLATNGFLYGSLFLAFAHLYPNFEIALFFLLPVKIKWLAMLQWCVYILTFALGSGPDRWLVLASIANYLAFFRGEVFQRIRDNRRRMSRQSSHLARSAPRAPFHRCLVCGITSDTHPKMDFRYCSKCTGTCGYCTEHIRDHEHVTAEETAAREE